MENNNREKKPTATKTVGGKKRKRITITNHDADKKRSWSDLPNDILESIKKRLFFIDQVNFGVVCISWSCVERVPSLQQIPWLLVFDNISDNNNKNNNGDLCWDRKETYWNIKEKDKVDSCKLVDSKNKKTYTIDANVIKAKLKIRNFKFMKVHESKYGWLLISNPCKDDSRSATLYLYSPFFGEGYNFIELPVLNCSIFCATFTSSPLDKDCKILTLNKSYHDTTIVIYTYPCGQGADAWSSQKFECKFKPSWYGRHWTYNGGDFYHETGNGTMVKFDSWCSNRKWMYSEGNFYFVTNDGTMGKFDMVLGEWNVFPVLPLIALEESNGLARSLEMTRRSLSNRQHYIVKSSDGSELFLITDSNSNRYHSWGHDSNSNRRKYDSWRYSGSHHIHRLDLSSMIWEDLDSIGDHVLFIGDGYNSILNSSVLKSNGERKDISDKIYYCKDDELKYCSVPDYTLKTKTRDWNIDHKPYRKQNCSRHYGPIATKSCRKMLIDPPPL